MGVLPPRKSQAFPCTFRMGRPHQTLKDCSADHIYGLAIRRSGWKSVNATALHRVDLDRQPFSEMTSQAECPLAPDLSERS